VERARFVVGMDGKSPLEKLRELGLELPEELPCLPVVLLDEVATVGAVEGARCGGLLHFLKVGK